MQVVQLKKGKRQFLDRRHPWIFSGALASDTSEILDGTLVKVLSEKGQDCAIGFFSPGSIAVRVLSFEQFSIDQQFWNNKIENAFELRKNLGLIHEKNNICRIVHGEGDGLPGLIIDYYNGVAVIQPHAVGMYLHREAIASALQKIIGEKLRGIYIKAKETLPNRSDAKNEMIFGSVNVPHQAIENEITFEIDWIKGQKTGFFIDQREHRKKLMSFVADKKVLNTFCYSGGFSLFALAGGAKEVHSVDASQKAIDLLENNLKLNRFKGKHVSVVADAVKYVEQIGNDFDVIILDPPAFAKHTNKRHNAIKAYTRLNAHAIQKIKNGGIIFTFSCSQVVSAEQFQSAVVAAAIQCKRNVRILQQLHQPGDHPISAFHPEGGYLKGLIIHVE
ncbi:MAG: class I SAM-dependent rRNA methyltransferase [Crocinitomicaceae bacterium]|nr:class I SAM-dependent rRNA methyltransferase [Crocinitomicaceae bacterium]